MCILDAQILGKIFVELKPSQRRNKIPESLFFEKIDGKSFYYKGYKVKDEDWITKDWNQEIELLNNEFFNIGQFLADEGVKP